MRADETMPSLPSPEAFFGRRPLAEDVVIRWSEMIAYFERLSGADPRLVVQTIGQDRSGRPLIMLVLGRERRETVRAVVAITAAIHAHELAGSQMMPAFVFDLLTSPDPNI